MDRDIQKLCFQGLLLWGALYVYLAFIVAGYQGNRAAQIMAVATAGVTYLDYMLMLGLPDAKRVHFIAFAASLSLGLVCGLLLLR